MRSGTFNAHSNGKFVTVCDSRDLGSLATLCFADFRASFIGSSGFLVGKHRPVPGHDAQACRSERAHSFIAERFSERPGAVKAALGAAKRSLDGEDRSGTIPREGMARWTVVFGKLDCAIRDEISDLAPGEWGNNSTTVCPISFRVNGTSF
jgi:hypothetical protein